VINAVRDSGITEQELSDTKNYLIGSFPLEQDTQNELAGMLIGIQYYNLGKDYLDKRSSLIQKVTLSDVNTLAKELLSVQPIIVMAGAPEGAPATSAAPKSE
jgi:zinc protease